MAVDVFNPGRFQVLADDGRSAFMLRLGIDASKGHVGSPSCLDVPHFYAELPHNHLELFCRSEIVAHSLCNQFLHLLHVFTTRRVKTLVIGFLRSIILIPGLPMVLDRNRFCTRCLFLRLVGQSYGKAILLLQLFHDIIAALAFPVVRNLLPVLVHTD